MNSNRITLITLAVEDLNRARAFYEALGWEASGEETDGIVFFNLQGQKLALYSKSMLERDIGAQIPHTTGQISLAQNFSSEKEVDEWHARALKAGATEVSKPEKVFWGGYSGYHHDLDGHLWEFAFNPFWEITAAGMLQI